MALLFRIPNYQDEIKQYLPRIVALLDGTPQQNQVVKTVFSRITTGAGNTSPPISSQDLLMALHDMEGIPLKKVVEGKQYMCVCEWRGKCLIMFGGFSEG